MIQHQRTAGLVFGVLALCGLAGCKGGSSTEQASPAQTTANKGARDDQAPGAGNEARGEKVEPRLDDKPIRSANETDRATGEAATMQPRPAIPEPKPVAEPGCEKDCKEIGYCVRRGGKCVVGSREHCRQSDICRIAGACSTKEERDDDGSTFLTCTATTDTDCANAETCKEKGNCKAMDGQCTNAADPVMQKYRADKVKNVRDLAFKVTRECEATKAKTLRLFTQDGLPDPAASWAEMEGLNRELIGVVIDFRRGMLAQYDLILNLVDTDKDLLGAGCYDALKAGVTKGKDGCLFNGSKLDTKWLKALAKTECDR
ncbi:MAG: hypothetical protein AMXMBFR64_39440 [Myxococcales bacterium]